MSAIRWLPLSTPDGDNESYAACNVPSFTAGTTDLAAIARDAGIPNTCTVKDAAAFEKAIDDAFQANGASFIVVKTKLERVPLPNAPFEGIENKYRFIRYVEQTENIQIINPPAVPSAFKKASPRGSGTKG